VNRVVVVGGGITGLATAYYLQKRADQDNLPLSCTLVESAANLGGKVVTLRRDGFVIEGGPDALLTQKPWGLELCRELGLADRLVGTRPGQPFYLLMRGRLVPFPPGVVLTVPTKLWPILRTPAMTWPGKLRMGLDLILPPRRDDADESLADFVRRRLGREALETFAEPLLAGVHVADPERLSLRATFPRLAEVERRHGSLIRGFRASAAGPRPATTPSQNGAGATSVRARTPFVALRGGMQELVDALATRLGPATIVRGRKVVSLDGPGSGASPPLPSASYRVHLDDGATLEAGIVVLATPSYVAADLVEPFNPDLASGLRQIRYVSTATISLGFRRDDVAHPLNGTGFLIPRREKRRITAGTWTSSKFEDRAPEGHVLLRAFVGGARDEAIVERDDAELVAIARSELGDILGIDAEPILAEVFRWRRGMPQYDVGHRERVAALERRLGHGLFLAGSTYGGVGLPDCIHGAQQTAETIARASTLGSFG